MLETCITTRYRVVQNDARYSWDAGGLSGECCMATEADKVGEEGYGQCERGQLAGEPPAELWVAYRAAVARRDEWCRPT